MKNSARRRLSLLFVFLIPSFGGVACDAEDVRDVREVGRDVEREAEEFGEDVEEQIDEMDTDGKDD